MTWLRERPERWEELDTVDWQGKFISDQGDEEVKEEKEEQGKGKGKGKLFEDEDEEDDDEEEEEEEEEVKPSKPPIVLASPAEVHEKAKGKSGTRAATASPAVTPVGGKVRIEKVKGERTR
jgi:hypothetical protein